jgi:hypothetical protein
MFIFFHLIDLQELSINISCIKSRYFLLDPTPTQNEGIPFKQLIMMLKQVKNNICNLGSLRHQYRKNIQGISRVIEALILQVNSRHH